jgi:hypothetical protein
MKHRLKRFMILSVWAVGAWGVDLNNVSAQSPILVRAENFTVTPSTGPVMHIRVRNTAGTPSTVTVEPSFPEGWQWTPKHRTVTLKPHQLERVPFAIEKAMDVKANQYPVEIAVKTDAGRSVQQQTLVCASAPHFKPKIDGRFKDWSEAIPVSFISTGRETVVSTYWNQKHFCIYVQVEEDELIAYKKGQAVMDAVQLALAPGRSATSSVASAPAQRYEFLMVKGAGMFAKDRCFCLIKAGTELSVAQQARSLESLAFKEAQVAVKRKGKITHYECAIPWSAMPSIRADVGREISLSFLIHDPDGTGIRDWGQATGLWAEQRTKLAWCALGASVGSKDIPYDSKVEWGLCSSKH